MAKMSATIRQTARYGMMALWRDLLIADVALALRGPCRPATTPEQRAVKVGDYIAVAVTLRDPLFDRSRPATIYGLVTRIGSRPHSTIVYVRARGMPWGTRSTRLRIDRTWITRAITEDEYEQAGSQGWPMLDRVRHRHRE